jgi:hypothetical protein
MVRDNLLVISPASDCRSRKLDLRALGRRTARFSDPAHAVEEQHPLSVYVSAIGRDRVGEMASDESASKGVCCCDFFTGRPHRTKGRDAKPRVRV